MNIEEADEIRLQFGKYMEVANPQLMKMFHADIPESLLPYPKAKIEKAMNICVEYCREQDDQELVNVFESMLAYLDMYVDDRAALAQACKRLGI